MELNRPDNKDNGHVHRHSPRPVFLPPNRRPPHYNPNGFFPPQPLNAHVHNAQPGVVVVHNQPQPAPAPDPSPIYHRHQ